jgi:hypothetical protein
MFGSNLTIARSPHGVRLAREAALEERSGYVAATRLCNI